MHLDSYQIPIHCASSLPFSVQTPRVDERKMEYYISLRIAYILKMKACKEDLRAPQHEPFHEFDLEARTIKREAHGTFTAMFAQTCYALNKDLKHHYPLKKW